MPFHHRSARRRYAFALAALSFALLCRWSLSPVLGGEMAAAGLLVAILATAWYGGFGPAALVSLAGPASMEYLFPEDAGGDESAVGAILYFLMTLGIAVLGARIAAGRRRIVATAEELRTTLYSIGDAVLVTDANGLVTSLNPAAQQLTGWTLDEATGLPLETVFVIVNELTRKPVENPVSQALRKGTVVGLANHSVLIARNGAETPIDDSAAPIRGPDGDVTGVVLVFRDVAERRRAENELRRERETARFLADASAEIAKLANTESTLQRLAELSVPFFADWCIIDMVEPTGSLRRVAAAHVQQTKVESIRQLPLTTGPGKPEIISDLTEELLGERVEDVDYRNALRQLSACSYVGVPIKTRGQIFGAMTFVFAASGRRYSDADLAVAEDLAHRAAVAIENTRLYQVLRDADKRKDEFLAMLAHELRNPLAPIRNGLELLAMTSNEDRDTIQLMEDQVKHLTRLVDDLLDVSRIVCGKVELRRETLRLDTVAVQSVAAIRPSIEDRVQQLRIDLPQEPIWLCADPVRLAQILENLLGNASKYTDHHGQIELIAARNGDDAIIRVRDNGVGIEPELLPHVFELFTQSPRAPNRPQGGLGIGLTLVRNLVEMHGGTIVAQSEGAGRGTTFTVRLPVVEPGTEAPPPPLNAPPSDIERRILIVDDNDSAAHMLSLVLSRIGPHKVATAHDGPMALRLVKDFHPDVVFLDIGLPGMDGFEVARAIRMERAWDNILIVALTGYGQEEDRRKSREAGFDEHLVKPTSRESIEPLLQHPKLHRSRVSMPPRE